MKTIMPFAKVTFFFTLIIVATSTTSATELKRLLCSPPAQDMGYYLPARVSPTIEVARMQAWQVSEACTTISTEDVISVSCFSLSVESRDREVRAGWQCVGETPCGDGSSFSEIIIIKENNNGSDSIKACATLRNTTPRMKTLFINVSLNRSA